MTFVQTYQVLSHFNECQLSPYLAAPHFKPELYNIKSHWSHPPSLTKRPVSLVATTSWRLELVWSVGLCCFCIRERALFLLMAALLCYIMILMHKSPILQIVATFLQLFGRVAWRFHTEHSYISSTGGRWVCFRPSAVGPQRPAACAALQTEETRLYCLLEVSLTLEHNNDRLPKLCAHLVLNPAWQLSCHSII